MIDYLEIRDTTLKVVGVIDNAKSIIWECQYYGAGAFEIYAPPTELNVQLLQMGYYITRPDEPNAAIIEGLKITYSAQDGQMIIATGRMLKSILDRRIINQVDTPKNNPTRVSGNLATAVRGLIQKHAGSTAGSTRSMGVYLGSYGNITTTIPVRQTSFGGLLEFTDGLLQEFGCGALMRIQRRNPRFIYDLYEGKDRTVGNAAGNTPIIFSQNFENLLSTEYTSDMTQEKNAAVIGGQGEGLARFYVYATYHKPNTPALTGLNLREKWIDASNLSQSYTDDDGNEQTYSPENYAMLLVQQGTGELKQLNTTEVFTGEISLAHSPYKYGQNADFWLGDQVTIQDDLLGQYINVRILKATEVQDDSGYSLSIEYGN